MTEEQVEIDLAEDALTTWLHRLPRSWSKAKVLQRRAEARSQSPSPLSLERERELIDSVFTAQRRADEPALKECAPAVTAGPIAKRVCLEVGLDTPAGSAAAGRYFAKYARKLEASAQPLKNFEHGLHWLSALIAASLLKGNGIEPEMAVYLTRSELATAGGSVDPGDALKLLSAFATEKGRQRRSDCQPCLYTRAGMGPECRRVLPSEGATCCEPIRTHLLDQGGERDAAERCRAEEAARASKSPPTRPDLGTSTTGQVTPAAGVAPPSTPAWRELGAILPQRVGAWSKKSVRPLFGGNDAEASYVDRGGATAAVLQVIVGPARALISKDFHETQRVDGVPAQLRKQPGQEQLLIRGSEQLWLVLTVFEGGKLDASARALKLTEWVPALDAKRAQLLPPTAGNASSVTPRAASSVSGCEVDWKNFTYPVTSLHRKKPFTLRDGKVDAGAEGVAITLTGVKSGDMDGDGKPESLLELTEIWPGANTVPYGTDYVYRVGDQCVPEFAGELRSPAASGHFEGGAYLIEALEWRPDDPMCCPTAKRREVWKLVQGKVKRVSVETTAR